MAGPRPSPKPKSPLADRPDDNDSRSPDASPIGNNPGRLFQRSNTIGSLAALKRQHSVDAKAPPILDKVRYDCWVD